MSEGSRPSSVPDHHVGNPSYAARARAALSVFWGERLHMHLFPNLGTVTTSSQRFALPSSLLPCAPEAVVHVLLMVMSVGRVPHLPGCHASATYVLSRLV